MAQDVKNDIKKAIQVNTIPLIAIMTAVTTVLTMFVKIPTPTRGYLNLSDTMIFFSSYAFGPWVGGIIGGQSGMLLALLVQYGVSPKIVARENLKLWHSVGTGMYALQWLCAAVVLWRVVGARKPA